MAWYPFETEITSFVLGKRVIVVYLILYQLQRLWLVFIVFSLSLPYIIEKKITNVRQKENKALSNRSVAAKHVSLQHLQHVSIPHFPGASSLLASDHCAQLPRSCACDLSKIYLFFL